MDLLEAVMLIVVFVLFVLIYFTYQSVSEKTLSRPLRLLIMGIFICFFSASLKSLIEMLQAIQNLPPNANLKMISELISTTTAALGGGLIVGSIMSKAQIMHKEGLRYLESKEADIVEAVNISQETINTLNNKQILTPDEEKLLERIYNYSRDKKDKLKQIREEIKKRKRV